MQITTPDGVVDAFADASRAGAPGVDGALDVLTGDGDRLFAPRPVVRLVEQVGQLLKVGGHPLGVTRPAGGLLDGPGHGRALQRQPALTAADGGDELRVERLQFRGTVDLVLEIGRHPEELTELAVVGDQ